VEWSKDFRQLGNMWCDRRGDRRDAIGAAGGASAATKTVDFGWRTHIDEHD